MTLYDTLPTHYMGVVTPTSHTWEWQLRMSQYENGYSEQLGVKNFESLKLELRFVFQVCMCTHHKNVCTKMYVV